MFSMPSMPKSIMSLPILELNDDTGREEGEEDNKMIQTIMLLQTARKMKQSNMKKKHRKKIVEEINQRFSSEGDAIVTRHNKRWAAKYKEFANRCKTLRTDAFNEQRKGVELQKNLEARLGEHTASVNSAIEALKSFQKEVATASGEVKKTHEEEIKAVTTEVRQKLAAVDSVVKKIQNNKTRDKMSDMIKELLVEL